MTTQEISALCREYHLAVKNNGFIEVEIRLTDVDFNLFQQIYESMIARGPAERDHSVNAVVSNRDGRSAMVSSIRRTDLLKKTNTYSTKRNIRPAIFVRPENNTPYKISVAEEKMSNDLARIDPAKAVIRIKNRLSFRFIPGWRLDMTIVRSPSTAVSNLKDLAAQVCPPDQTPATFLSVVSTPELFKFEVELEYDGPPASLSPASIQEAATKILLLINPKFAEQAELQAEVFFAAKHIINNPDRQSKFEHSLGLKQLLPSVRGLTRVEYYRDVYPPVGYHITDKAHGARALVVIRDNQLSLLSEKLTRIPDPSKSYLTSDITMIDGELLEDGQFLAFDVIMIRSRMVDGGFEDRVGQIAEAVSIAQLFGIKASVKTYIALHTADPAVLAGLFPQVLQNKPYNTDGLILVPPGANYLDTVPLKWKPIEEISNDFLALTPPESVLGPEPFVNRGRLKLHFLFATVSPGQMARLNLTKCPGYAELFKDLSYKAHALPIQFQPATSQYAYLYWHDEETHGPISGKIVELGCGEGCFDQQFPNWRFLRIRHDREEILKKKVYFGNNFHVADLNALNFQDVFPLEMLSQPPSSYFQAIKSPIYNGPTRYLSIAKQQSIETMSGMAWVVDLGIGRGSDVRFYNSAGVVNLVGVDNDRQALSETVIRSYTHKSSGATSKLHLLHGDFTQPYGDLVARIRGLVGFPKAGCGGVMCHLAMHYACSSVDRIKNFAKLCSGLVHVGGKVVITVMDAQQVLNKLGTRPQWQIVEGDAVKYSIQRHFTDAELTPAGQQVGVLLPFSRGEHYLEYLVNSETLVPAFRKENLHYKQLRHVCSDAADRRFKQTFPNHKITSGDKEWLSLFHILVFEKV